LIAPEDGGGVDILLGKGDGTFQAAVTYFASYGGTGPVASGDFNGDGLPDLAMPASHINRLVVMLGASVPTITSKNSASYATGGLAPDAIAFVESPAIASALAVASTNPWPTVLGSVHMDVTDSQGQTRPAPIYFVDIGSMSFLIPGGTAIGQATLRLTTASGTAISAGIQIDRAAPGLFTANANGTGVPAGFWIRAGANGAQAQDYLFDPALHVGYRAPLPIDLGAETDRVFLSLYGTGFRNATHVTAKVGGADVPAAFAAVGAYQGEDVVNVGPLPRSLVGRGTAVVALSFDGKSANPVYVDIR
jgi:uncharacterized protein (TIGR03437 family)